MKKRYWIICAFAVLFLACVFIPPAQAKSVHEEGVKPCIVVEPWITAEETVNYTRDQAVKDTIFVRRAGYYRYYYEGYIKLVKSIPTNGGGHLATYHGVIFLAH